MQYLCLVYIDPQKVASMSDIDLNELTKEALCYDEELRLGGHYIVSNALQSIDAAVTIRVGGGGMTITDGPFAETKEHLGGYILIDARDLNDAIRLASRIPPGRLGCVEVRPTQILNPS